MTAAPSTLSALQAKLVANLGTTNLGIVGDTSHVETGGYHIGAADLRAHGMSNDYSLEFPADRNDTSNFACAIDIGGTPAQLMTIGQRLVNALRAHDPRVYGRVRGTNAPFDGDATDRRYDCENPATPVDDHIETSSDRNHVHIEIYRTLVQQQAVIDGLYDVLAGVGTAPTGGGTVEPPAPAVHFPAVAFSYPFRPPNHFGDINGPATSHGGNPKYDSPAIIADIRAIQARLNQVMGSGLAVDGNYGPKTIAAVVAFQHRYRDHSTSLFGQFWGDDAATLFGNL